MDIPNVKRQGPASWTRRPQVPGPQTISSPEVQCAIQQIGDVRIESFRLRQSSTSRPDRQLQLTENGEATAFLIEEIARCWRDGGCTRSVMLYTMTQPCVAQSQHQIWWKSTTPTHPRDLPGFVLIRSTNQSRGAQFGPAFPLLSNSNLSSIHHSSSNRQIVASW